ncbi:MAG: hypothetical protein N2202_10245, partial [Proteobacteria bacterium]|nr:hypothetical protein [Pseudomonadota bacterium]
MFNSSYRKQVIIEKEDNKLERSRSLESEKSVYLLSKENFFQIDVELLNENVPINFPLFTIENMFFKEAYEPSTKPTKLKSLKENRLPLFIKKEDIPLYEEYLKKVEEKLRSDGSIKTYSRIVRETSKILVQELLMDPRSGEKIKETKDYIENVCEELLDGKISFI